jgi:hypothetical protein
MPQLFPAVQVERYEGLHHLNTSHAAAPERVAAALEQLWTRAERGRDGDAAAG